MKCKVVLPLGLRELVVRLVLAVGVEVEDALDEVLAEHFRVLLQQQVDEAVFAQAARGNDLLKVVVDNGGSSEWDIQLFVLHLSFFSRLPGNGGNWVNQRHHEAEEEGALPFHKLLLGNQTKTTNSC